MSGYGGGLRDAGIGAAQAWGDGYVPRRRPRQAAVLSCHFDIGGRWGSLFQGSALDEMGQVGKDRLP